MVEIKTRYEFIHMNEHPNKPRRKTKIWGVYTNDGYKLGIVKWSTTWRRYIFAPVANTEYDAQCMTDLTEFLSSRTRERKEFWKNAKDTNKTNDDIDVNRDSNSP